MKITVNTELHILSKDGMSTHNLAGLMNMARGGTEPSEIAVFTDRKEAERAERLQKLRQAVSGLLEDLDIEQLGDVEAYVVNHMTIVPGPDHRLE